MSETKSRAMIRVPFSWEKVPGVPKFMASPMLALAPEVKRKMALPLPPGCFQKPVRSSSKRMYLWEEDPFVAAMIVCTKDCDTYKGKGEIKKSSGTRVRLSKSLLFSCKHSFDVEEGNLSMMPMSLGSIVRQ